jgi:hypothetical protein
MKCNVIIQRIMFSLCMNYKKHKPMYDTLFDKMKISNDTNKK